MMTREELAEMSWKATMLILAAVISIKAGPRKLTRQ